MCKFLVCSGLFLGLGVLVCTPLWGQAEPCVNGNIAGFLCVTPSFANVVEGTPDIGLPFTVTNNTGQLLILDYAMWVVKPDASDNAFLSYLATANLYLANGDTGVYDWHLQSPGDPLCTPTDCDFGMNPVTFSIEMSPGDPRTLPPTPTISGIQGL